MARAPGWDLAIVLDLSESTLHPSGLDLDGDGPQGRTDPALLERFVPSGFAGPGLAKRLREELDFEDTILAAELEATSALLERVAGPRLRTGLIGFSDQARVLAPLGSPPAALEQALADLRTHLGEHMRGTHYAAAIEAAHRMLVPEPEAAGDGRQRAIVFLSDGAPSLPVFDGDHGRGAALRATREAGLAGIHVFAFAFGDEGAAATELLAQMAEWTEGRSARVAQPEQLVSAAARARAGRRGTRGDPEHHHGRSRARPAALPGWLLRRARQPGRRPEPAAHRSLHERRQRGGAGADVARLAGQRDADEAARGRELLALLRQRTAEMEAWAEVEHRRQEQRRSLTIEANPGP